MEQEKILSTLSEQLGETSFSQQTLQKYIELNPLAEGVEPDEAYFTKAVNFLKGMQGQYNHDVATKVEDFKKNYKPTTKDTPPPPPPTPNKEVEEMRAQMKAIQEKLDASENQKVQAELLSKVKAEMKAKNATDSYVLEKTLQGVTLDSSKPLDTLVNEMLSKYDTEYKACRGDGATPRNATGGGNKPKTAVDNYFARKAKREGWGNKS